MQPRYLIVQLADIGDLILSTPALAALREAHPDAQIDLLTTAHAAPVIPPGLVSRVIALERQTLTGATAFFRPASLRRILGLREGRYEAVIYFHHFTIRAGTLKFALIGFASGASRRIGLENGNGWFLTERLPDGGFGARHQAQYWLDLVGLLGADTAPRRALVEVAASYRLPVAGFEARSKKQEAKEDATSFQLPASSQKKVHSSQFTVHSEEAVSYQIPATSPEVVLGSEPSAISYQLSAQTSSLSPTDHQPPATSHLPLIVIHAGGGGLSRARRWSPTQFAAVADALAESHAARIVLVGGKEDDAAAVKAAMRAPALDLTGQTTLPQLAKLLSQADCFIGAESGVMHLAAASGVPVVAIFGPGNPTAWGPWQPGGQVRVIRSGVECSPCSYVGHGIGLREGCAARTCLKLVTVAQVVAAVEEQVHSSQFTVHSQEATSDQLPASSQNKVHSSQFTVHSVKTSTQYPVLSTEPQPSAISNQQSDTDGTSPVPTNHSSLVTRHQPPITILGLPVHPITYAVWLEQIAAWVRAGGGTRHVCTLNPEFVMIARRDPNFWNILQRASLCVPDGVGLLWAAKRQGTPLPERVTGSDGVPIIAKRAAWEGWRLYLLGAGAGVAERTATTLRARYPGLQIAGVYAGSPAADAEDAIVERINASGADILFVAYGAPEQDKWIARNLPRLRVTMAMGVGGAFDFIAGVVPRAPTWMQRIGIEWLFRLYLQPWRIGRMMRLPRFVLAVMMSKRTRSPKV